MNGASEEKYEAHVTVADINQNMLDVGQKRASEMGYSPSISPTINPKI